jgi:hypothetical protein
MWLFFCLPLHQIVIDFLISFSKPHSLTILFRTELRGNAPLLNALHGIKSFYLNVFTIPPFCNINDLSCKKRGIQQRQEEHD